MAGIHEVPSEFKDEEKWLLFFSKRTLIIGVIMVLITLVLSKITGLFHATWLGFGIGLICTVAFVVTSMIMIPTTEYMRGGGLTVDKWLLRRFFHKKSMGIYAKHYNSDEEQIIENERKRQERLHEEEEE